MSADKKIRVAIVGLGFGAEFIPIFQNHPERRDVRDLPSDQKELDATGDRFGVKVRYTEYDALLADPERRRGPHQLADCPSTRRRRSRR